MHNLFAELNIRIPDAVLDSVNSILPTHAIKRTERIDLQLDYSLFGKELSEFLIDSNSKIQLVSFPTNWHAPWQKNENTIIRIPAESYIDSAEFFTESPATDKDTMFANKFKTYKIPYDYKTPYILNGEKYHSVINYSNKSRHCIDIVADLSYNELLDYFAV
jgi:hypothetical protein